MSGMNNDRISSARRTDRALESFARMLLARYGVLFRDLLTRERRSSGLRALADRCHALA